MFSTVQPAYRCLPIGSLGGRDTITSEVLPHTTHDARYTSGKKIYRAKHVLSKPKGRQARKVTEPSPSYRANARDLRKISPFGRNDNAPSLRETRFSDFFFIPKF
jgi:hypothetical protein